MSNINEHLTRAIPFAVIAQRLAMEIARCSEQSDWHA